VKEKLLKFLFKKEFSIGFYNVTKFDLIMIPVTLLMAYLIEDFSMFICIAIIRAIVGTYGDDLYNNDDDDDDDDDRGIPIFNH